MVSDNPQRSGDLANRLRGMNPQATVRAIVTIDNGAAQRPHVAAADPMSAHLAGMPTSRPSGMPTSRAETRRALIESQTRANTAATASVRSKLQSLGLDVRGGALMPVFVVEGFPDTIERVLEIDGIASVELDQEVSIDPSPMRP